MYKLFRIWSIILFVCLAACARQEDDEIVETADLISPIPAKIESEASSELTIIGQLTRMGTPADCGIMHCGVVAEYTNLTVINGTYTEDKIRVVHGCPELARKDYAENSGTLEEFKLGDFHSLILTTENVNRIEAIIPLDQETSSEFDYYSRQVNLYGGQ